MNARPLCPCSSQDGVIFEPPSRLAGMFADGQIDVALLPVFELFRQRDALYVDNVAIACRGAVRSVVIAHCEPLEEIRDIWLDPASRTSIHLAQVLFREHFRREIRWHTDRPPPDGARVVIGDPALRLHLQRPAKWRLLDLGEQWKQFTRLPFVFAVWALSSSVRDPERVADRLRAWKNDGLSQREAIVRGQGEFPPAFLLDYLTRNITFDLGDREKEGMELFREKLVDAGLVDSGAPSRCV